MTIKAKTGVVWPLSEGMGTAISWNGVRPGILYPWSLQKISVNTDFTFTSDMQHPDLKENRDLCVFLSQLVYGNLLHQQWKSTMQKIKEKKSEGQIFNGIRLRWFGFSTNNRVE